MDRLDATDPRTIGGYRLLGRLGEGGMGRVYLARSGRGRTVAVKSVKGDLAGQPEFRRRFTQEITAARRVGAEWTAPVLDADPEAPEPWVATGYIAGPSLADVVDRDYGPLPENSVRALTTGLVRALQAIHGAGLVHRDLKPSNVLITIDGPRVIDFGIARALDGAMQSSGGMTRTGSVIGSPGFMSPEQVRGRSVTGASDVFCLGAVLAYAATGRLPFGTADSGAHALMFRIAQEPPDLDELSGPLYDLVAACLQKDPEQRPDVDTLVARTEGPISGTWLPGQVLAQLGRDAVQLLDSEEPEGSTDGRGAGWAPTGSPSTPAASVTPPSTYHPALSGGPTGQPYQAGVPYGYPQQQWMGGGPHTAYGTPAPYRRPVSPPKPARSVRTIGTPTWVLLLLCLLWSLLSLGHSISLDAKLSDFPEGLSARVHPDYSSLKENSQLLEVFGLLIFSATLVLWLLWFFRLRMNAEAFEPGRVRYDPGMALGVWFIPVCNFFMPKQIMNDVWSVSRGDPPKWYQGVRYPPRRGLVTGWWTMWVIYFLFSLSGFFSWYDEPTIDEAKGIIALQIFSAFFAIPACILAVILVARLTNLQEERIAAGA